MDWLSWAIGFSNGTVPNGAGDTLDRKVTR